MYTVFCGLSSTVEQNGELRHKLNTVTCFSCLQSDVKEELWEQFQHLHS